MKKLNCLLMLCAIIMCVACSHAGQLKEQAIDDEQIHILSGTLAPTISNANMKSVAVIDFVDLQGNINELGKYVAEELSMALINESGGFDVIDRNNLRSILKEHKLSMTGLVDPSTIKELGKVVGIDALIVGTVTPLTDTVRISARVISTETAKILGASAGNLKRGRTIDRLLSKGVGDSVYVNRSATPKNESKVHQKAQQSLLQALEVTTNKINIHNKDVRIKIHRILDTRQYSGSYEATVEFSCVFLDPQKRGVVSKQTAELSYEPSKFSALGVHIKGMEKLYDHCRSIER